jgi:FkbM family methyltransferase
VGVKRTIAVVSCLALLVAAGAAHEYLQRRTMYRFGDFPDAPSPSLRLEVAQRLGWAQFHGQFGQDKWIVGVVFPGVRNGYFVDVGSADGVLFSNTKALEDLGWTGVAIDPFPTNWSMRKCLLFQEVVSKRKGDTVEFRMSGALGGIVETLGRYRAMTENDSAVRLTTTTIADVLERARAPRYIHYVSLDVEGAEYDVLQAFPFSTHEVGAFTIEHNGEEPRRSLIRSLLESKGYRFVRQQVVEDWYVRR